MNFHRIRTDQDELLYTDHDIVARTRQNKDAFTSVIHRYEAPLLQYIVLQIGKDGRTAKELLQEIFINVYIYLNDYDSSIPFSSWIYRFAYKETESFLLREKRIRVDKLKDRDDSYCEIIMTALQSLSSNAQQYTPDEILDAFDRLESRYRDIFILKYILEKTDMEISDILEIHPDTVIGLERRSLEMLKGHLDNNV